MRDRPTLECRAPHRRDAVRTSHLNGIDYVEIVDETLQTELRVYLFRPPAHIATENVRIDGGRRIRDIRVVKAWPDPAAPNALRVRVDRAGDFSTYTLRLVDARGGHPTERPAKGFDARCASAEFSFKSVCPSTLDCVDEHACLPAVRDEPDISYLAKDYSTFRQLILDRLALIMPDWQERHVPDVGLMLVELLAYVGDHLSYYQDAVATEAYLDTARERRSVRRHVRLVDYRLHEGCNARAWLAIDVSQDMIAPPVMASDLYFTTGTLDAPGEIFEPLLDDPTTAIELYEAHNTITFYTWGDVECCLPSGATSATLRDGWLTPLPPSAPPAYTPTRSATAVKSSSKASAPAAATPAAPDRRLKHLKKGDFLILEEAKSPVTGSAADRDPARRHAVRLTSVRPGEDALYKDESDPAHTYPTTPVVEIAWALDDALPFPLCISAKRGAPACDLITDVSVAHGNVILVDHGRTLGGEDLGEVGTVETVRACECEGSVVDVTLLADRFEPALKETPLTFAEPLPRRASASALTRRDPRAAAPQILSLIGLPGVMPQVAGATPPAAAPAPAVTPAATAFNPSWRWTVRNDLFRSGDRDADVVVEIDNEGLARLRFGDGQLGRRPDAGSTFTAIYRVGNGPSGNVGAETIVNVVWRGRTVSGVSLTPRNPLPAAGGAAAESIDEAKLFAPHAFRTEIERAITADDYARLAERLHPTDIQRAGASLCWNGSWYEARVAVDPRGTETPGGRLLRDVEGGLYPFRRMGHDLDVRDATYVPLEIALQVCVLPHHLRGHVEAAVLDAFSSGVRSDGTNGLFHPDNLSFGRGIFLSRLVAEAQSIAGVESVLVTTLRRLGEADNGEIENGILPIGPLEIARLDNDPDFPEHGRLTVSVGGGR